MSELWIIRKAEPEDHTGLCALWLEQVWHSRYGRRFVYDSGHADYILLHKPRIENCMARSEVRIACDPDDPSVFWGFTVTEGTDPSAVPGPLVHCVFLKRSFLRSGYGADILRDPLGSLLQQRCFYSSQLIDMTHHLMREANFTVPTSWIEYPYGLGAT